jgi:hypothetical protein
MRRAARQMLLLCALCVGRIASAAESPDQLERGLKEHEEFVGVLTQLRPKLEAGLSTYVKQPEVLKLQCRMWQGQMAHSIGQARRDEAALEMRRSSLSQAQADRLDAARSALQVLGPDFESCKGG